MSFSSSGLLSGTPTSVSSGSITFTATNGAGSANLPLTLVISASGAYDTVVNLTTGYNTRAPFAVPVTENVTLGVATTSKAVKLTGTGPVSSTPGGTVFNVPALTTIYGGGTLKISVDGGAFLTTEQPVYENSIIQCQYTLSSVGTVAIQLIFNASTTPVYTGQVVFWAADTSRAPVIKQVGPGKTYATIAAAINSGLVAGDTVEIYPGTYTGSMATNFGPVSAAAYVSANGTPSLPITFKGIGATRPIIQTTGPDNRCFWINASYIKVENLEFINLPGQTNYQDYVQVQGNTGNVLTFDQCFFHGSPTYYGGVGYLSNDTRVGTQIFTRCEIVGFGGSSFYGPAEHGIYASGAWQHYPDLYLEVNQCYFDYVVSNSVKSRVKNNRFYFNTFVNRPGGMTYIGNAVYSYVATAYAIECIRNYEYSWVDGEYSTADIFGNLIVRNTQSNNVVPGQNPYPGNSAAIRTDNDGQGPGFYRVRLVNNSIWFDSSYLTDNQPVITSTQNSNTQYFQNNAVVNSGGASGALNIFSQYVPYPSDPGAGWLNGKKLSLVNNWLPPGSYETTNFPVSTTTNVTFGGPPNNVSGSGGVQSATFATLDMTPSSGSALIAAGTSISSMPADYALPAFNSTLNRKPLPLTFVSGTTITYQSQSVTLPIGAIGV
jgi:hypothetical protein